MPYIRKNNTGKSSILKNIAFCHLLGGKLPNMDKSITELFSELDQTILSRDSTIKPGSLGNIHGDWYEWLIAYQAWNHFCLNPNGKLALLLPNANRFRVSNLYTEELSELIDDLRNKVAASSNVELITSNPDFVIIDNGLANEIFPDKVPINSVTTDTIKDLETKYLAIAGRCNFHQLLGYMSVKSSLRPDRRLQIPHEGSLMKAIYTHLQTRNWVLDAPGIKYFAITATHNKADQDAMKTVATHSITIVSSKPQAAVDNLFIVNSLHQAQSVFEQIL